jgi:hypothetical protein
LDAVMRILLPAAPATPPGALAGMTVAARRSRTIGV